MTPTPEQYASDRDRAATPSDAEILRELDAYGHLTWTVGDEDWVACFDAIRCDDRIGYHVVIDSESAGFTDTVERAVFPATQESVDRYLVGLPRYWADIAAQEHGVAIDDDDLQSVADSWESHCSSLIGDDEEATR